MNVERNQKAEQRQARHGLHDIGEAQNGFTQRGFARQQDAQRNADEDGDAGGNQHQKQVLEGQPQELAAVPRQEFPQRHAGLPASWPAENPSAKARASGCCDRNSSSGGPSRIISPSLSNAIRLASKNASAISWVTNTMVLPSSRCSVLNSRWISRRVIGSKAPKG